MTPPAGAKQAQRGTRKRAAQRHAIPALTLPKNFLIERISGIAYSKHHASCSRYGGKANEYTKVRWLDDPKHLPVVEVSITMYYSLGRHFYVDIREGSNPLMIKGTAKKPQWGLPWEDTWRSRSWSDKFDTEKQAQEFMRKTLISVFGKNKVAVAMKAMAGANVEKWFYRDGD